MSVRELYGKVNSFNNKDICYVGNYVCSDRLPAFPKTSADPIPTNTPGGSCDNPVFKDADFLALSPDQKASATLTTNTTQDVTTFQTFEEFKPNPALPQIPAGISCKEVTWEAPDQTSTTLTKVFVGNKVRVRVRFKGYDGVKYTLYATGAGLGETYYPPKTEVAVLTPNSTGDFTLERDFVTPFKISGGGTSTAENNYFLGFMLHSYYLSTGSPVGPLPHNDYCYSPKVVWVSERVKKVVEVITKQQITITEYARFGILNGYPENSGPAAPTAIAGDIHPLEWIQTKQVAAATFDLQMYEAKTTAKESPSAI